MSHTLELLAGVEHGTPDGYRAGCRGSAASCGAAVSCAEVYRRYQGDWGFRKRVNAGESPADIVAAERADADARRARDRAAARAEKQAAAAKPERKTRALKTAAGVARPEGKTVLLRDEISRLHSEGLTDGQIATALSEPLSTINYIRKNRLELPRNVLAPQPRLRQPSMREARRQRIQELHEAGATDQQIADALGVPRTIAAQARGRLRLPVNPATRTPKAPKSLKPKRPSRADRAPEVARLHKDGLSDAEIGAELGLKPTYIGTIRRDLGLKAHRSGKTKWDGVELAGHGTNACWTRGCPCTECYEAHLQYHREYTKRRKTEGAGEHHGTAYGYQLGCRGESCPKTPSCTDAMLRQDRARRRAAGIPEKNLVDAAPVREHLTTLKAAGMTGKQIAEAAGVPFASVKSVLHSRGAGRPPVATLLEERAAAILTVQIEEAA